MKLGRVVGIDDGYFVRGRDRYAPLVATVMKGSIIEGFRFGWITVDGNDVTEKIKGILEPYIDQVCAVFLYGTIYGGTNVVSLREVYSYVRKPVIAVVTEKPNPTAIERSFVAYGAEDRLNLLKKNPPMKELVTKKGLLYASFVGGTKGEVLRIVEHYQINGKIPEPLRVSHLVGSAMGEWV